MAGLAEQKRAGAGSLHRHRPTGATCVPIDIEVHVAQVEWVDRAGNATLPDVVAMIDLERIRFPRDRGRWTTAEAKDVAGYTLAFGDDRQHLVRATADRVELAITGLRERVAALEAAAREPA